MAHLVSRLTSLGLSLTLLAAVTGCGGRGLEGVAAAPTAAETSPDELTFASTLAARAVPGSEAIGPHEIFAATLAQFERNGNGAIERAEAKGTWLERDFDRMDTDHSGHLTEAKFERFLRQRMSGPAGARGSVSAQSLPLVGGVLAGLAATAFGAYMAYAGWKGSDDIMHPEKEAFAKDPSAYGDDFTPVTFMSHDGLKLSGWYVPAAAPTNKGILLIHGHGGNKDNVYRKYGWLHQKYNLFVYDQRYCGKSEGKYMTLGMLETRDAVVALDQLRSRGNTAIALMGESLGGAVAIEAGAIVPDVKAVWNDCAFDTVHDAVGPRAAAQKYPFPNAVADAVVVGLSVRTHLDIPKADPIRWVKKIAPRPFYLVHGMKDTETTPMNGQKLFAAATEPKTAWWAPDAKHAETWKIYPDEYKKRAFAFFEQAL